MVVLITKWCGKFIHDRNRKGIEQLNLFFPSLEAANIYLNEQADKTGMMVRPSNLEDIFVELTGRKLD